MSECVHSYVHIHTAFMYICITQMKLQYIRILQYILNTGMYVSTNVTYV